jgi:FkbM family methyltransferase
MAVIWGIVDMSLRVDVQSRLSAKLRWPILRHFPQGIYLARDIKRFFPNMAIEEVFDVGANVGQTAVQYAITFPAARIDSFEPISSTYDTLCRRTARNPRIHCHNFALGSASGEFKMSVQGENSDMSTISDTGDETVTVRTAVDFCNENGIEHINLFKVDTEGFDLEVVRGAEQLIVENRIDLIQVEAGMNPENTHHIYFEKFTKYLHELDYRLFGIYDQFYDWPTGAPRLRRANMVFASPKLIN